MTTEQLSLAIETMTNLTSCKKNLNVAKAIKSYDGNSIKSDLYIKKFDAVITVPESVLMSIIDIIILEESKEIEELEKKLESI